MDICLQLARFSAMETERLLLTPFRFSDEEAFWQISQSPSNVRFVFPSPKTKEESTMLMVTQFMKAPLGSWAIRLKQDDMLIGMIRLEKLDWTKKTCEIGYLLKESEWGQGYMTESLKTIVFILFYECQLKSLHLIIHTENKASQRVAQKAGFSLKRRYKGSDRYTHQVRTYLEFVLDRKDYTYE
ncbi:GNAT family N-acetyltransferase [Streptococcus sp. zg-JUN1979]|uniref:GNAT family N-acetyltransferase n=1 Tax=Streptococcus sp. zg-JUN1979 TaxID=3391450 RepID=UPI0039A5204F